MAKHITELPEISGVQRASLTPHADTRGRFLEVFRQEWFPQRDWRAVQINRSESVAGVLRGLHYHFKQVDYWYPVLGSIRVGLADLRPHSPTAGAATTVDMDAADNTGLYIPTGVAHGFAALTDVILFYVVDNYYSGDDELGLAWNDPDTAVPWNLPGVPILSGRDQRNPALSQIRPEQLPR